MATIVIAKIVPVAADSLITAIYAQYNTNSALQLKIIHPPLTCSIIFPSLPIVLEITPEEKMILIAPPRAGAFPRMVTIPFI